MNINMHTPSTEWREQFRKIGDGSVRFIATRQEVTDFIEALLLQQRTALKQEMVNEIEGLTVDLSNGRNITALIMGEEGDEDGLIYRNEILSEVLEAIKKL